MLSSCRAPVAAIEPEEALTTQPAAPSTQPIPIPPVAAFAYVRRLLRDDTRLVEVFTNETERGVLDSHGRAKLIDALPTWFVKVTQEPNSKRFKITPEMGIRIYGSNTADGKTAPDSPNVFISIYKHRGVARITISDPERERLSGTIFILNTPEPIRWIDRLFAGKL